MVVDGVTLNDVTIGPNYIFELDALGTVTGATSKVLFYVTLVDCRLQNPQVNPTSVSIS